MRVGPCAIPAAAAAQPALEPRRLGASSGHHLPFPAPRRGLRGLALEKAVGKAAPSALCSWSTRPRRPGGAVRPSQPTGSLSGRLPGCTAGLASWTLPWACTGGWGQVGSPPVALGSGRRRCSSASAAQRPYDIHSGNTAESLVQLFSTVSVQYVPTWSKEMVALLRKVSRPSWPCLERRPGQTRGARRASCPEGGQPGGPGPEKASGSRLLRLVCFSGRASSGHPLLVLL